MSRIAALTSATYLLIGDIKTADKVQFYRARAEAIDFSEMIIRLGRTLGQEAGPVPLLQKQLARPESE